MVDGGFAEYAVYPSHRVFGFRNLSDTDATLLEPAACAAHGLDKIAPKPGSRVLLFGAGPTGLILAQLLRLNGGCQVVIAAPGGLKMNLARSLNAGDDYIELPRGREDARVVLRGLQDKNPYRFDIVVEATGSAQILEDAIHYVRRGGKLVVYGVYKDEDKISLSPNKIFKDEIQILGSFSQMHKFPTAIDYLDTGRVRVEGIVNRTFKVEEWQECLDAMKNKSVIKAALVFD
ncbi:hypothetical protein MW887_004342 [Aspergillus wentii]|nr:hypothetical protein MW887_004342 [Aspergillus wentii]